MRPRVDIITLAVDDLERALQFYSRVLEAKSEGIVGTEFAGDDKNAAGAIALFNLDAGLRLALYPRTELAKDANVAASPRKTGEFSIGHLVANRKDVDSLLARAQAAGARLTEPARERPWGIYSGYFQDPDGHLWEIIHNPD